MTCRGVRKRLSLYAGGDLPVRQAKGVRSHLESCAVCRRELVEWQAALVQAKAALRAEDAVDWGESEWKDLMARVTTQGTPVPARALGLRPRLALASGLAALMILTVVTLLFKDKIFGPKEAGPGPGTAIVKKEEAKPAPAKPQGTPSLRQEAKRVPLIQPEIFANKTGRGQPGQGWTAPATGAQDVVSVTMVSQETGLQVVWFFNKNFDWKGEGK